MKSKPPAFNRLGKETYNETLPSLTIPLYGGFGKRSGGDFWRPSDVAEKQKSPGLLRHGALVGLTPKIKKLYGSLPG
jgi:hypothetical protein